MSECGGITHDPEVDIMVDGVNLHHAALEGIHLLLTLRGLEEKEADEDR